MVRLPAGDFVMGDAQASPAERPLSAVRIERPFWISRCEVTNRQYQQYNARHDSRFEHRTSWIFSEEYLGWRLNDPAQPVVRVTWDEAMAFCRWLSDRSGLQITLPSEAQWEYACRAGTETPFSFGDLNTDFAPFANMADATIRNLAYEAWRPKPPDIVPRENRFDDLSLVTAAVATYRGNAWGVCDAHGNAAEWTRTAYRNYPYQERDGRNDPNDRGPKVVRGGSWRDRPRLCTPASRVPYQPYQRVYNVGFRVVCEDPERRRAPTTRRNDEEKFR
jgi:formylglycine-generating enzyme required for sulfatase activity